MALQYAEPDAGMAMQREKPGPALQNAAPDRRGDSDRVPRRLQSGAWEPGGNHRGIPRGDGGADGYRRPRYGAGAAPK